jgi:hypothetical protein
MKAERKWTIAIRPAEGQPLRKITKIVGLNGGGFSVLAPYHKSKSGFLWKMPVDPSRVGPYAVPWKNVVTAYTADDRVKLSYHADGFAQFSSEFKGNIISGIDEKTGQPKGLGLFTNPLTSPIWSGGSAGVTVWGMDEFEEVGNSDKPIIFEPDEFYYRGCFPDDARAWKISIWAFPVHAVPPVRFVNGQAVLDVAAERLSGSLASVMRFKVLHLRKEKVFLGVNVHAINADFKVKSGWLFTGPGDYAAGRRGHVLMGSYPRLAPEREWHRPSLNREPLETNNCEPP